MATPVVQPEVLSPPVFNGTVVQCQEAVISWTGGQFPVRVQAFYQKETTADWKNAGLPAEAADTNVLSWTANVPAGSYAWITLVDHTGTYKQSSEPVIVEQSDDASCLESSATASVVTQTVYMNQNGSRRSQLDDRSLLITAIVFGILFFAAAAGLLYLYSILRQTRKARFNRGSRFNLADDESSFIDSSSGSLAAVGGAIATRYRKTSQNSDTSEGFETAARRYTDKDEEKPVSPTSTHGEGNPFLDPPLTSAGLRRQSTAQSDKSGGIEVMPTAVVNESSFQVIRGQRPELSKTPTNGSMSSATSMQLFNSIGNLRVMNDPANISTPVLSRQYTASSLSHYPDSTSVGSHGDVGNGRAQRTLSVPSIHSHTSHISGATSDTADHYESEPHSSKRT